MKETRPGWQGSGIIITCTCFDADHRRLVGEDPHPSKITHYDWCPRYGIAHPETEETKRKLAITLLDEMQVKLLEAN